MKAIKSLTTLAAAAILLASCSQESFIEPVSFDGEKTISIEAIAPDQNSEWNNGDKVGLFSSTNENIRFTSEAPGVSTTFKGSVVSELTGEYVYLTYPYVAGATVDSNNDYTYTISYEQIIEDYSSIVQDNTYSYMIGHSVAPNVKSNSSFQFDHLMSQMNIVVANQTESGIIVKRVIMESNVGKNLFSTSATINMDPSTVSLESYKVAQPSVSALSVYVANPSEISAGKSEIITLNFFPVSVEGGTELRFTIETNKGNFEIVKTIGGVHQLSFDRGEKYITPLTLS